MVNNHKRFVTWSIAAVVACLVACGGNMAALLVFARLYPAYEPRLQPISALGAIGSPIAGFVSVFWICMGFFLLIFAFFYYKSDPTGNKFQKLTAWLIGIYALGDEMGSGIFPGNHIAGHLNSTGIIHNVIGGIGVLAITVAPMVLRKKYTRPGHLKFRRFLTFISIFGILSFLIFTLSGIKIQELYWLRKWHGLLQRIFMSNYYLFMIVIAAKMVMENKNAGHGKF